MATTETFVKITGVCTVSPRFNPAKHRAGQAPTNRIIVATAEDGTEYIHELGEFGSTHPVMRQLTQLLRKIDDAGKINLAHWTKNTGKRLS